MGRGSLPGQGAPPRRSGGMSDMSRLLTWLGNGLIALSVIGTLLVVFGPPDDWLAALPRLTALAGLPAGGPLQQQPAIVPGAAVQHPPAGALEARPTATASPVPPTASLTPPIETPVPVQTVPSLVPSAAPLPRPADAAERGHGRAPVETASLVRVEAREQAALAVRRAWLRQRLAGSPRDPSRGVPLAPTPTPTPLPTPTPIPALPITGVAIPSIGLQAEVVPAAFVEKNGVGNWEVPAFKAGHAQYTAGAGAPGNAVLFGHVTSLHSGNVFADLDKVHTGDLIHLLSGDQDFVYRVVEIRAVPRDDISVIQPTDTPTVTLITCTGTWVPRLWDYDQRLVVRGELLPEGAQ